jgi:hypothetical protein
MPQVQDPVIDQEGLPVPSKNGKQKSKQDSDFDSEGLPIPHKKKDDSGSAGSPLDSSKTPQAPTSVFKSSDVHYDLFGKSLKEGIASFTDQKTPVKAEDVADSKTSILGQAEEKLGTWKNEKEKADLHQKIGQFRNDFLSGNIKPEDVDLVYGTVEGVDNQTIADAINQKTKNLKTWANISVMKGFDNADKDIKSLDEKIKKLQDQKTQFKPRVTLEKPAYVDAQLSSLQTQRAFLSKSINQVVDAESDKQAGDLFKMFHNSLNETSFKTSVDPLTASLDDIKNESWIKYNPHTNTLSEKTEFHLRQKVDDWMNDHPNEVINYGTLGTTKGGAGYSGEGKRANYKEVADKVVSMFNTIVPYQRGEKELFEKTKKDNPKLAPLLDHQQEIINGFSQENISKADSVQKVFVDKGIMNVEQKYDNLLTKNRPYIAIQEKWAQRVADGTATDDQARKKIYEEAQGDPGLKKVFDAREKEKRDVIAKGANMWQDFIINNLKKVDPKLTYYSDGTIGVEGMTKAESQKAMSDLEKAKAEMAAKIMHDQHQALELNANERAKNAGAFFGSLGVAIDAMHEPFQKWLLVQTGYGSNDVEMFQAKESANIPLTQSDEGKSWNWKGARSLLDPKFYMAQIAGQMPLMGGLAAIGAATEGAGIPEAIQYLGAAGLFDVQNSLQVYDDALSAGYNKYGDRITEYEAGKAASDNFKEAFPLDVAFMALNLGTLSRATMIKPSLEKAVLGVAKGAALGTAPMAWQGYLAYANSQKAKGVEPDINDYLQDGHFFNSIAVGILGGLSLGGAHTALGGYAKQTENWKRLIYNSEGEFHDRALINHVLQQEMQGNGNAVRDDLKLMLANQNYKPEEKDGLENLLAYSTALDKNIKGGGIDVKELKGAYQAHNLALADLHDFWAIQNEGNKNLSKIYSDQAKEFRDIAKNTMEGNAQFHYLMDPQGHPIFISDNAFKVLDQEGTLGKWMKSGMIKGVYSSSEPGFSDVYMNKVFPPDKPKAGEDDAKKIILALKEKGNFTEGGGFGISLQHALGDVEQHEGIVEMLVDQYGDNPSGIKKAIGKDAFEEIEPMLKRAHKIEEKAEKEETIQTDESKKVLDQPITDEQGETKIRVPKKNAKTGEIETEDRPAKEVISRLKDRHNKITELINCLGAA